MILPQNNGAFLHLLKKGVFSIEQIEPFKEFTPSSAEEIQIEKGNPSKMAYNQVKNLLKEFPEFYPSKKLISSLVSTEFPGEKPTSFGTLLAVGHALDFYRLSGCSRPLIFASASGIAAHILLLSKPTIETRGWETGSKTRLDLLSNSSMEKAYWTNTGGTIRQITFSDTDKELSTWLAVRQDSIITIFRPLYSQKSDHPTTMEFSHKVFASSHLHVNPVASISIEKDISRSHSDISFNPWLQRQFATVDSSGCWNIYNVKKSPQEPSFEEIVKKSSGNISDGHNSINPLRSTSFNLADDWHRIIWICNASTIVVCNRFQLAIFNLYPDPLRLQSPIIISTGSFDWIVDIVRSSSNNTQLFILTTSRIYWIQVTSSHEQSEDKNEFLGGKVILSYRHLRSPHDESLKLVPVKGDKISLLLTSAKHQLISVYFFRESTGKNCSPYSQQSSFTPSYKLENGDFVLSACFISCRFSLVPEDSDLTPGSHYYRRGVKFYQLWLLTPTLKLISALFAVRSIHSDEGIDSDLRVIAPVEKIEGSFNRITQRATEEPFIVSDGAIFDESIVTYPNSTINHKKIITEVPSSDDLRLRLDWRRIFQEIFPCLPREKNTSSPFTDYEIQKTEDFLSTVSNLIHERFKNKHTYLISIYEICKFNPTCEDISKIEGGIKSFLDHLNVQKDNSISGSCLVSYNIAASTGIEPSLKLGKAPDLININNQLNEYWISSLSKNVSKNFRDARAKMIRKLAIDLYLGSIGILLGVKKSTFSDSTPDVEFSTEYPRDVNTTHKNPMLETGHTVATKEQRRVDSYFPSLSNISSGYSSPSSSPNSPDEDPAITHLRQYAISIKSKSNFGKPAFLEAWSSIPGSVPNPDFLYETTLRSAEEVESEAEEISEASTNPSERLRKKKRHPSQIRSSNPSLTQLLKNQKSVVNFSEIASDEVPLTQSNPSTLGGISLKKNKKPKKQRTAGF